MQHDVVLFLNLYQVNLSAGALICRKVFKETGKLLGAFVLGALATVAGTVLAFKLVPLTALGAADSWKIAAALAARHEHTTHLL